MHNVSRASRSGRGARTHQRSLRLGLCLTVFLAGAGALWMGCGTNLGGLLGGDGTVASGIKLVNVPPTIDIIQPSSNLTVAQGDRFTILWDDDDPDDNASISIFLDPDLTSNNGNELLVLAGRQEDPDGVVNDSVEVDTALLSVPVGTFRIIALIQDAAGNSVRRSPDIVIQVLPEGISPGNQPPKLTFLAPTDNIGVVQGDKVCVVWDGSDSDNPEATVTLSLDYDLDPTNDDPNDASTIIRLQSGLPLSGVVGPDPNLLDPNTVDPNACQGFEIVIDTTGLIPPRADGLPYYIQALVDDGVNPPVYRYAIGSITVQRWAAGVVDLHDTGAGLAGAIFQGFHGRPDPLDANQVGGLAGSGATAMGDFDGDGYDDFIVLARYSNPRGRGQVGQGYLIYGRATRFSSINSLNSVGTNIRGVQFHAPKNWAEDPFWGNGGIGGDGGLASVAATADFDLDGLPEIIFGLPDVYWYEYMDDDPLDEDDVLYLDDLGTSFSDADPANDDFGFDRMSAVVYVSSQQEFFQNRLVNNTINLALVGQRDPGAVSNDEGFAMSGSNQPRGARFRGDHPSVRGATGFGETVSTIPDTDNDGEPELLLSAPNAEDTRGRIDFYLGRDFAISGAEDPVISYPTMHSFPSFGTGDNKFAERFLLWPSTHSLKGALSGDRLGRALHAGDFNQDGSPDIACGAPDADRNNLTDCGVAYIVYGQLVIGDISIADHPRIEIVGTSDGDRLGETQGRAGDFNGDGNEDVVLGSRFFDPNGAVDAGFAAVLLGFPQATGERIFSVNDIATPRLPGVKFIGASPGAMAGAMVSTAGDFNGDGRDDILIAAPGAEYRFDFGGGSLTRLGVCYLIFGNNRLTNKTFSLDQVGSAELPGIVFVSPYEKGSADEAGVDTCFAIGDINGDGFDDILIGNTTADYVNPANPSQRRIDAGEAYVVYGNNFGTNDPDRW